MSPNSPPRKPTPEPTNWTKLTSAVLNTARLVDAFGWSEATAAEYVRPFIGKCKQAEAVTAFRDIFDETGSIPSAKDVLARIGAKVEGTQMPGDDVYLHDSAGFCYGPGVIGLMNRGERINGKPTGRLLVCRMLCGCARCHQRPGTAIPEPLPIDLPDDFD
jgi:hypothetical protein